MKRRMLTYGAATTLALGAMSALAQTPDFTGSVSVRDHEALSDRAEYERHLELATVSLPEAVAAARGSLGSAALPSEVELDEARGYLVWEVTVAGQAVLVDAGNAEILATVREDSDEDPARAQVSLLEAVTAAQAEVGREVSPSSVSLDDEDGELVWEIEFGEQELGVNAITGSVIASPTENLD